MLQLIHQGCPGNNPEVCRACAVPTQLALLGDNELVTTPVLLGWS